MAHHLISVVFTSCRVQPSNTLGEAEKTKPETKSQKSVGGLASILQLKTRNDEIHSKQLKVIEVCSLCLCFKVAMQHCMKDFRKSKVQGTLSCGSMLSFCSSTNC